MRRMSTLIATFVIATATAGADEPKLGWPYPDPAATGEAGPGLGWPYTSNPPAAAPGGGQSGPGRPRHPACPPRIGAPIGYPIYVPYPYPVPYPPPYAVSGFAARAPMVPNVTPMVFDLPAPDPGPVDPFGLNGGAPAFDPLAAPMPPRRPAAAPPRRAADRERAAERLLVGDRLVRAGELKRAVQRYEESIAADPSDASPYVRIAQVQVLRGRYAAATDRLREAQTTEPGWLLNAGDVQNFFGDPADFADMIHRLETHLQANPDDRDAWLVLGAELYLTGRTRQAADIFLRLTDRRPDETLAAFLDASRAVE